MDQPAALLFDLDGTLVDTAITIAAALSELSAARGGGAADVLRTRRLVSKGAPVLVQETLGRLAKDSTTDVAEFRVILAGIPAEPGMIFPGAIDSLEDLTAAGHPCAVVTNKPEGLARLLLDELGMTRYFAAVVGGDTLAVCKPNAEPLRHALDLIAAHRGLMIGDSPIDAQAAEAAHMPFILYERGYEVESCDGLTCAGSFARFDHLPGLVARLESALVGGSAALIARGE